MKKMGMFTELLGAALCMSLALAIAVPCFWSADQRSKDAYARDMAVPVAESFAAAAIEYQGDAEKAAEAVGGDAYGRVAVVHIDEVPGCLVALKVRKPDGCLGSAEVTAYNGSEELFSFPVTWQEGDADETHGADEA